jgi:hypothetical protein
MTGPVNGAGDRGGDRSGRAGARLTGRPEAIKMTRDPMPAPLIALLTDCGEDDCFVPSFEAVPAGLNPGARTVDVVVKAGRGR